MSDNTLKPERQPRTPGIEGRYPNSRVPLTRRGLGVFGAALCLTSVMIGDAFHNQINDVVAAFTGGSAPTRAQLRHDPKVDILIRQNDTLWGAINAVDPGINDPTRHAILEFLGGKNGGSWKVKLGQVISVPEVVPPHPIDPNYVVFGGK